MKNKSTVRQAAKIVSFSFAISTASALNSAGAQAAEPAVSNVPVALIDFTCGDGMHFDFNASPAPGLPAKLGYVLRC